MAIREDWASDTGEPDKEDRHVRGRIRSSTFRLTLAAALIGSLGLRQIGPSRLDPSPKARCQVGLPLISKLPFMRSLMPTCSGISRNGSWPNSTPR